MVDINKNTINDVVFTLQEKSQLWNLSGISPFYLFSLKSQHTNETINFISNNIAASSAKSRYDEFYFIETGSSYTNLTAGTINLTPAIFWDYTVYEQILQYNLNIAQTIGIVERGRIFVNDSISTFNYTSYSGQTGTQFISYSK